MLNPCAVTTELIAVPSMPSNNRHHQAAYLSRANQEMPAESITAAPCSWNFPNLNVSLTPDATEVTVTVRSYLVVAF